jgi:hypothetical protein
LAALSGTPPSARWGTGGSERSLGAVPVFPYELQAKARSVIKNNPTARQFYITEPLFGVRSNGSTAVPKALRSEPLQAGIYDNGSTAVRNALRSEPLQVGIYDDGSTAVLNASRSEPLQVGIYEDGCTAVQKALRSEPLQAGILDDGSTAVQKALRSEPLPAGIYDNGAREEPKIEKVKGHVKSRKIQKVKGQEKSRKIEKAKYQKRHVKSQRKITVWSKLSGTRPTIMVSLRMMSVLRWVLRAFATTMWTTSWATWEVSARARGPESRHADRRGTRKR